MTDRDRFLLPTRSEETDPRDDDVVTAAEAFRTIAHLAQEIVDTTPIDLDDRSTYETATARRVAKDTHKEIGFLVQTIIVQLNDVKGGSR